MFVEFRSACLAAHGLDLRDAEQKLLSRAAHTVRLLQGYSRNSADGDRERAFVEGREEASAEGEEHHHGGRQQRSDSTEYALFMAYRPVEGFFVIFLEPAYQSRFLAGLVAVL